MTTKPLRVIIVEDSDDDLQLTLRELKRQGYDVTFEHVEDEPGLTRALSARAWDIILSDWSMPRFSGLEALRVARRHTPDAPFLLVSGTIGEDTAVEALRAGANDFLIKGKLSRLGSAIERELREREGRAERKRLEDQLRQAQKMEAVGRLAAGVAHDFNNMLSIILSYATLVERELKAGDPIRNDLEQIKNAGLRAANLTRQLLTFSRQQVVEPSVLDLNALLTEMERMLQRILGEDVDLVFMREGAIGRVCMDPSHIEQVIMNLVVNARDAMPTGGKLTIETRNVVLDDEYARDHLGVAPGPYVMLAVSDTGAGMDQATQARIFEPFFTTKEFDKGTGLGLSTVFGIVQQCGGSIWVYSEVGTGTTFKIYIPRAEADAGSVTESRPAPATLHGSETILLVEDEAQILVVAREILTRNGYRVIEAQSAKEALARCESYTDPIHLLVTDVVMPHMSGPELAKRVTALRPEMKVLCMSGYTNEALVRHGGVQAGIAYLQKPIMPDTLIAKVRAVLDAPNSRTATRV